MSSLFVGNLSSHVRHRELENVFRRFGRSNLELKDGFGFVVYEEHRDAKRALDALQGRTLCGEQPSISWARKRRPFQRYTGKPNISSKDKYQNRRRQSLEMERGSDDARRDEKFPDEGKDGSRVSDTKEGAARSSGRDAEWKDSGPEKPGFDEEMRDLDPLDSGRWDPNMEGSPENTMVEGLLEDEVRDKDIENEKGSADEKSPVNRLHIKRLSHRYGNSFDQQPKRGRDAFMGRPQERCYNCGQSGHVKWQCRSRPKRIGMHVRDGSYDSRRNDSRHFSGRGGFRGIAGGRFRGMNGSRRMVTRDVEAAFAKRSSRRHDITGDRRQHYNPDDTKIREKNNRRRRRRSESPKDSSSRGRSKRKQKKSNKKSTRSTKKRQRSSSVSPSSSQSTGSSSSSSSSVSRSRSAASRSQSSKSGSSSSSGSHSRSSQTQSSRSRSLSASSSSRSRSVSSQSRKTPTKSRSRSRTSGSQAPSRGILSPSPPAKRSISPHSISQRGSRFSTYEEEDKEVATSSKLEDVQGTQACEAAFNNGRDEREDWKYLEGLDMDQTDVRRGERKRVWSREAKKQKSQRSDGSEERDLEAELQSNGVKIASSRVQTHEEQVWVRQDGSASEPYLKDLGNFKGSEPLSHNQMADTRCTVYMALMKRGSGVTSGHDGGGQELATTASFGAARLWPWESLLYRRLKRGPISTANYDKRKAQNEEFGIEDKFVRSSSGWWEKQEE